MNDQKTRFFLAAMVLFSPSFSALAHTGSNTPDGFATGFIHPWQGLDHVLAMTAVGLWAAASGGSRLWVFPATFLAFMALGALMGFASIPLPAADFWTAFSVFSLGLILVLERGSAYAIATPLIALFALAHGSVHSLEASTVTDTVTYALGFLTATLILHGIGMSAAVTGPTAMKWLRPLYALVCALMGTALLGGV